MDLGPYTQWYPALRDPGSLQPHTPDPVQDLHHLFSQYLRDLEWRRPTSDGFNFLQPHTANFIQDLHRLFNRYPLGDI